MERLPHTSHKPLRSSYDKLYESNIAAATDRKIRNIISTRRSGNFLDTTYAYNPPEKLQISDSFEVSSQLSVLKTLMDRERFSFTRGDVRLARLRSEGSKIGQVVTLRKNLLEKLKQDVSNIEDNITYVISLQASEVDNQTINLHVLDRMRTTLVYLRRKYRKLEYKLHDRSFELTVVSTKSTKTKEAKTATSHAFLAFRESITVETSGKQKEIEKLEKDLKKRKELSEKKLANKHRHEEMMEKAMIEDQSAELEDLREKYLLHFMWYMASTIRFEREQVKWKRYEDAFLRIKLATGVQEIPVLVEKYLTKEQIYTEFLGSVSRKELELADYREKIDEMQENLDKLNESDSPEIFVADKLQKNELHAIRKQLLEENAKMKHMKLVRNKIKDWCNRFSQKLQKITDIPNPNFEAKNIAGSMQEINKSINIAINHIKENKDQSADILKVIQYQNVKTIVDKIPQQQRIRSKVSDALDLSDLSHIETKQEDQPKKHK